MKLYIVINKDEYKRNYFEDIAVFVERKKAENWIEENGDHGEDMIVETETKKSFIQSFNWKEIKAK